MQDFQAASGVITSIPKSQVGAFGGGHTHVYMEGYWRGAVQLCTMQELCSAQCAHCSSSLTDLGMVFSGDRHITHAIQARCSKACASLGLIFSRIIMSLHAANIVQHLVQLQEAFKLCLLCQCGYEEWA